MRERDVVVSREGGRLECGVRATAAVESVMGEEGMWAAPRRFNPVVDARVSMGLGESFAPGSSMRSHMPAEL